MGRKRDLTKILGALRRFSQEEARVPTYTEAMSLFGYRSKNAVYRLFHDLEELGYLQRSSGRRFSFTKRLTGSIKLLGAVQAGFPSPAEEELIDVLSLDEYLVRRPEATFMLTVSGDSMIDAGIHPGDIVLVEKGTTPKSGDIVIAQVDGEWTLKYYRRTRAGLCLEPANPKYKTIIPKEDLTVGGVIRGVVRKYS